MKVAIIDGGTRERGNTEFLAKRATQGLTVDHIYLRNYSIKPIEDLRHTEHGFHDMGDDYGAIIDRMLERDIILFATPIYWYGMTGYMKNFIDRWSQTLRDSTRPRFKELMGTKTGYLIAVGGDEPSMKGLPLVQQFQHIFDYFGTRYGGYILGHANKPGDIESDPAALLLADQLRNKILGSSGQ